MESSGRALRQQHRAPATRPNPAEPADRDGLRGPIHCRLLLVIKVGEVVRTRATPVSPPRQSAELVRAERSAAIPKIV
eukprot:4699023-Prymnesium_polylepis.1